MEESVRGTVASMCQEAAYQTLPEAETAFQTLPNELQQWILARAGAPFTTCKAAAAVAKDPRLLATWLASSVQHPLITASQSQAWDTCAALLSSSSSSYSPSDYELFHATVYAAEAGRLELIDSLIMQGAWQAWLWGDTRSTLLFSVDEHYVDNSIWDRLKHITSEKEMAEAKAVIKLRHPLIGAAANGHTDVCRILLSKAVTARATHRALWAAARGGHVPVVQLLLAEAPNSIRDPYLGSNAVECAAEGGHLAVVQLLVQEGVDIEAARWALCSAAREGHLHIVEYLVTALPNVKQQYAAQKALFVAAERNHLQVVQYLLGLGTPTLFTGGHAQVAHVLRYTSALEAAAAAGAEDILQLLMCQEGWYEQRAWENALTLAVMRRRAGAAHLLLTAVGRVRRALGSATPCSHTEQGQDQGSLQLVKPTGADSSKITRRLNAAFVQSAVFGAVNVTRVLLEHGADVHVDRGAALAGAASQGHTEVVRLLLSWGAAKNRSAGVSAALKAAIQGGHLGVVALLVKAVAHVGYQEQHKLLALGVDVCKLCPHPPRGRPSLMLRVMAWWHGRKAAKETAEEAPAAITDHAWCHACATYHMAELSGA